MNGNQSSEGSSVNQAIEISIRLGLIVLLVIFSLNILRPFVSLVLWAMVIAVALNNPFLAMQKKLGGSRKLAITVFVILGLGITLIPAIMFSDSVIQSARGISQGIAEGTLEIRPPNDSVQGWPVIGERVHAAWTSASMDLSSYMNENREALAGFGRTLAGTAAGMAAGILQFVFSLLIAAAFLANAEASKSGLRAVARRLAGAQGDEFLDLSIATIRSVALGVLGIAFIQAVLGGLGMIVVGVPGAGLWALAILVLAIAQLPPIIILGPVAFYVFSVASPSFM